MKRCLIIMLCAAGGSCFAQKVVYDARHFSAVSQNAAMRSAAENTHAGYLASINERLDDLHTNVAAVALTQSIIYESLSNVNSVLKNGSAVRNIAIISADIMAHINEALKMARGDPYLVLFTGQMSAELRTRALRLARDVSAVVLKEGNNMLSDYNSRDILLRNVTEQLQVMNALAYGAWKAMFWARQRGLLASVNPFDRFISQDRQLAAQIIINAKHLKP